jgi:uncharacterized protein YceH (UPF0502 family)
MLDPIQQRILGVLIEKEATVPDSYPLTDNSLLIGCNQKNNRDPEMGLEQQELEGPLRALQRDGWVSRIEQLTGYRTIRWRHHVESQLNLDRRATAVLCELLLRGPQAPGALKPRVARLGFEATPEAIEAVLADLAKREPPLVEQMPLQPRERDRRWTHLLGPRPATAATLAEPRAPASIAAPAAANLGDRVAALEAEVTALRQRLETLERR